MKVSDVMTRGVETVSPAETLDQAAKRMKTRNIGFLPVVDEGKILGVVTDRDIVLRAISEDLRAHFTRVRDVMTKKFISCRDDQSLTEVSMLMEKNFIHRLLVLDRAANLVGVISLSDIAAKTRNDRLSGHVLGKIVAA